MQCLSLRGFSTPLRVNGRTLEADCRPESRNESYLP